MVLNDSHNYLVDVFISINVNVNAQTLDIIYVGIDNSHSWSIITLASSIPYFLATFPIVVGVKFLE